MHLILQNIHDIDSVFRTSCTTAAIAFLANCSWQTK